MGNCIPTSARVSVKKRDQGRCVRCGSSRGSQWHHRRRRAVKDHYQHCNCNGLSLCATCHRWAHQNPVQAREKGFIVSAHEEEPWTVPVKAYYGWVRMTCDGQDEYVNDELSHV